MAAMAVNKCGLHMHGSMGYAGAARQQLIHGLSNWQMITGLIYGQGSNSRTRHDGNRLARRAFIIYMYIHIFILAYANANSAAPSPDLFGPSASWNLLLFGVTPALCCRSAFQATDSCAKRIHMPHQVSSVPSWVLLLISCWCVAVHLYD